MTYSIQDGFMPNLERLLRTLHEASKAFRSTPGRRGSVVALPDTPEVLVGGDLHGNLDNFRLAAGTLTGLYHR